MAMEQKLVEIKKPCTVNLDSVIPNENGKFCSVCQTSVIDFTQKSTEEIASYFQTYRPEKMCGVFKSELVQTDSKLDVFISYLYSNKLRYVAILVIGILIITGCKTKKHTQTMGNVRFLDEKINTIESVK